MKKYITKRLIQLLIVALGVTFIIFTLLYITPGDPVKMMMGESVDQETYARVRESMGLDDPFLVRYVRYAKDVFFHFDLGESYAKKRPVVEELMHALPNTFKLTFISMMLTVTFGIGFGIVSALNRYKPIDSIITIIALIGVSFPTFWLGILAILAFSVKLNWFPSMGFDTVKSMVLPCSVLAIEMIAIITRMTRSSMLEVINQDYISTAKAKGLSSGRIIFLHELKNALIPIITVIGNDFGSLLGGAVITESIFSINGIGRLMIDSIKARDYPVVQGCVLFVALMCCIVNLIVDILYMYIDPRIRRAK